MPAVEAIAAGAPIAIGPQNWVSGPIKPVSTDCGRKRAHLFSQQAADIAGRKSHLKAVYGPWKGHRRPEHNIDALRGPWLGKPIANCPMG